MATLPDLERALVNADRAGDTAAAQTLAREIIRVRETMKPEKFDATEGMSGGDKFLAGAGKAFVDIGRGTEQFVREMVPGVSEREQELRQESADVKERDADLLTGWGTAGNIAGNAALFAPTAFIPGANTYTGAALIGAGGGALAPVAEGDDRLLNTAFGAAAGTAGHALGRALGRMASPVQSKLTGEEAALAAAAAREGIPLSVGQQTGSKPLQLTESVMENLPFTSGSQVAGRKAQQAAFNQAVLKRAGIAASEATDDVLATQKKALGKTFEDIAGRNKIDLNPVISKLTDIADEASRRLTPDQAGVVSRTVDDILSQADQSGSLLGTNYQGWRSELGRLSKGGDSQAHYFSQLKRALDDAFSSQISGSDDTAWKEASKQYGTLKTILQAMGGAGKGSDIGNIPPSQLGAALAKQVGREGKALGRGDLNELSRIGRVFVRDNLPDSGTAQRKFYQDLLTMNLPGIGLGAGAGALSAGEGNRGQGFLSGAAIGAGGSLAVTALAPKLAQALMQSPAGMKYLTSGGSLTSKQIEALANALRVSAMAATPQYEIQ